VRKRSVRDTLQALAYIVAMVDTIQAIARVDTVLAVAEEGNIQAVAVEGTIQAVIVVDTVLAVAEEDNIQAVVDIPEVEVADTNIVAAVRTAILEVDHTSPVVIHIKAVVVDTTKQVVK